MAGAPMNAATEREPGLKVLLALDILSDGKEVLEAALPWLVALNARADVVYVDLWAAELLRYPDPEHEVARLVEERGIALELLAAHLPVWRRGQALVEPTSVREMLEALSAAYDLVLTGTHGRRGLARMWAGSVAEQIVRFSKVSVLVLRPATLPPRPSLLWAVGPEEELAPLTPAVKVVASALGARVDVLTVTELPWIADPPEAPSLYPLVLEGAEELRRARLAGLEVLRDASFPGEPRGLVISETGSASDRIVERAAGHDLVVVGTRSRTGLDRALLGSVAERVVRRASVSVLVLRPSHAAGGGRP